MFFTARVLLLMPGTLSITGLVVCIVHFKYLYALRLVLRYCTLCIWHHCVCIEYYQRLRCRPAWPRRGPSGWCGCPQPTPAVHRYWIYGTNCQHDIISTYRYWICHKPSPTVHGYAANHYNDYTAAPLIGDDSLNTGKPKTGQRFTWIIRDSTRCDASMILRNTLNLPKTAHRLFRVKRPRKPHFFLLHWLLNCEANNLIFHCGVEKRTLVTQIVCFGNLFQKMFPKMVRAGFGKWCSKTFKTKESSKRLKIQRKLVWDMIVIIVSTRQKQSNT